METGFPETLVWRPLLGLFGFTLCGCGLPPCYEGRLAVELGPVVEGFGNCAFQDLPGDGRFEVKTVGDGDFMKDICRAQVAEFVQLPADASQGGPLTNTGGPNMGQTFITVKPIAFVSGSCALTVGPDLRIDGELPDVDAAFQAQADGDQAFYVRIGYNGRGHCPEYFPEAPPDRTVGCMNIHHARMTKR